VLLLPTPSGGARPTTYWPNVAKDAWCSKFKPDHNDRDSDINLVVNE
jgi:hypothetical protein